MKPNIQNKEPYYDEDMVDSLSLYFKEGLDLTLWNTCLDKHSECFIHDCAYAGLLQYEYAQDSYGEYVANLWLTEEGRRVVNNWRSGHRKYIIKFEVPDTLRLEDW